jgi:hypothetical protein
MCLPVDVVGDFLWTLDPDVAATMIAAMVVGLVLITKISMSGLDGPQEPKLCQKRSYKCIGNN